MRTIKKIKNMKEKIEQIIKRSNDRISFCIELINEYNLSAVAELGVYRGDFAQKLLEKSQCIKKYTMIDPWRNLIEWNKPANKDNETYDKFYQETIQKTDFAKARPSDEYYTRWAKSVFQRLFQPVCRLICLLSYCIKFKI